MAEAICVYGAGVLLKHRDALSNQIEAVRAGDKSIDPVHDARVTSRRLRATIPLFEDCIPAKKTKKWLKQIKKVTSSLGAARDTDVQLEWLDKFYLKLSESKVRPGVNRLILRLRQKRAKLQAPLVEAMQKLAESGLLDEISAQLQPASEQAEEIYVYTPALYQHSYQAISRRLETFLSYDAIVNQPEKIDELHQMRIAAKWLRYTMEAFASLYPEQLASYLQVVRNAQDLLGEIHDRDVWQLFLPQFLEDERQRTLEYYGQVGLFNRLTAGIDCLEQNWQKERGELYQKFLSKWPDWQAEGLWDDLHRTIQVPFLQENAIYPPLAK